MTHALEPIRIGTVQLKNRIVFPSMCVFFCDAEGYINDVMTEYVRERARGGVGLLIIPGSPHGKVGPGRPALSHNGYIPGWKRLADVAHEHGAKLFCQLHPAKFQAGRGYTIEDINDFTPEYIRGLIDSYAACAARARRAGVDGVEIHGAHAHEVAQFLSPFYNRRQDEYGGSTERRARFAAEIVRGIKRETGADYPLIFRISGDELVEGGRRIEETAAIAGLLEKAGADAIHVSCGMPESEYAISAPMDMEDLFNADNAARVKAAVSIPVIAVNRITDMEEADAVIRSGKADLVAMARANLADPNMIAKYEGRVAGPVRRCIGCNQGCRDAALYKKIRCMQNARLGFETTLNFAAATEAEKAQKILIAGAGPAGLEAAYDLTLRGFRPLVYERESKPGGLINLAALPPQKERMREITNFRVAALEEAGIAIQYGSEVTPELLERERPDVLIVATGSVAAVPPIPGIDGENVVTADELLSGRKPLRGSHIVVLGGGLVGCEAADYLAAAGRRVEIVEMTDKLADGLNQSRRRFLLKRLSEHGVAAHLLTKAERVALPEVRVCSQNYSYALEGVDGVVVAAGRNPQDRLSAWAKEHLPGTRVFVIGDAGRPGVALDAIHQGARVAAQI
ncbi:NAD(P)/FAD-dependent oxidoreductase [Anaerotruncus massiliensis (ex Togo et al. 2019)]|uniref:NAD(P)/FAD-dependent oxidoreductase n=1 Tax=Anaerotruncus massiliensis (ex Togo et al. 2019) TaxID=1673720 RepID=UPI0027BA0787|nr:NAD(P)/FAD-dependent oxidoreductase [Anaerotruncus massiliensis (ex Togo et al. 2019)]